MQRSKLIRQSGRWGVALESEYQEFLTVLASLIHYEKHEVALEIINRELSNVSILNSNV